MNPDFEIGDLMVLDDHINLIPNPLIGPHDPAFGDRFPDMSETYDPALIKKAIEAAKKLALAAALLPEKGCSVIRNVPPLVLIFISYFFVSDQIMPLLGIDDFVRGRSEILARKHAWNVGVRPFVCKLPDKLDQLRAAPRSPVGASVEDDQRLPPCPVRVEVDRAAALIGEHDVGESIADRQLAAWRQDRDPVIKAAAYDAHLAAGGTAADFLVEGPDFWAGPYRLAPAAGGEVVAIA